MAICQENLDPSCLAFQGRWSHCNRYGSIGYLQFSISVPYWPTSYQFQDKWQYLLKAISAWDDYVSCDLVNKKDFSW